MSRLLRRLRTARTCEVTTEVWGPHDGCREFMAEPERHPCGRPATREVRQAVRQYPSGKRVLERTRCCTEHGTEIALDSAYDPCVEATFVRPLGGSR